MVAGERLLDLGRRAWPWPLQLALRLPCGTGQLAYGLVSGEEGAVLCLVITSSLAWPRAGAAPTSSSDAMALEATELCTVRPLSLRVCPPPGHIVVVQHGHGGGYYSRGPRLCPEVRQLQCAVLRPSTPALCSGPRHDVALEHLWRQSSTQKAFSSRLVS